MRRFTQSLIICSAILLAAGSLFGGVPFRSLPFSGMLVDEFGWPYESNLNVELHAQGIRVLSKSITPAQGRDYNFLIRIPYDSGIGDSYTKDAISPGDFVSVKITSVVTGAILVNTN